MTNLRINLANYFSGVDLVLTNVLAHPEIAAAFTGVGYDGPVIQSGRDLLDTARGLYLAQITEYGEQYAATQELNDAWQTADNLYTRHRQFAGILFKDDPLRAKTLALNEPKKYSFTGWLDQALRFYAAALSDPEIISALGRFLITQEQLEEGQALVQQAAALDQAQECEKAEAQQATRDRDAAIDVLNEWLAVFRQVARIALANEPQLLEALQLGAIS